MLTIEQPGWPQLLVRAGIMLAAVWVAAPGFNRVPRRLLIGLATAAVVLVIRPRLFLVGLGLGLIAMIAIGRSSE